MLFIILGSTNTSPSETSIMSTIGDRSVDMMLYTSRGWVRQGAGGLESQITCSIPHARTCLEDGRRAMGPELERVGAGRSRRAGVPELKGLHRPRVPDLDLVLPPRDDQLHFARKERENGTHCAVQERGGRHGDRIATRVQAGELKRAVRVHQRLLLPVVEQYLDDAASGSGRHRTRGAYPQAGRRGAGRDLDAALDTQPFRAAGPGEPESGSSTIAIEPGQNRERCQRCQKPAQRSVHNKHANKLRVMSSARPELKRATCAWVWPSIRGARWP